MSLPAELGGDRDTGGVAEAKNEAREGRWMDWLQMIRKRNSERTPTSVFSVSAARRKEVR